MAVGTPVVTADIPEVAERGRWLRTVVEFCRARPLGAIGAAIVAVNLLVALTAGWIAPYDPLATD